MLFFYIRHGDPVYNPDSLTYLGEKQAEAVSKRLAMYGIDRIYASTSNRAILTAKPTCELLKKDMETLDFANEGYAYREFTVERDGVKSWLFQDSESRKLFMDASVTSLGHKWYEHPSFTSFKSGVQRVRDNTYEFFKTLGYEHIKEGGKYKIIRQNDERVALFAHQGFGMIFLSTLLDIPYPLFSIHFDICHSGMTVIEFSNEEGFSIPKILTLSNDSHLYREGLPTKYNHYICF